MKIILIANYRPDAQQSMLRFGELLHQGLTARGHEVIELRPPAHARRLMGGPASGAQAKWLGYIDKYLFFPISLAREVRTGRGTGQPALVHVVDHSNALYVPRRTSVPWVATCHDLLAVRGALGEDTGCPASALGRRLQQRIVAGLGRAAAVACDSTSTQQDLDRLVVPAQPQHRRVILLAQNHPYRRIAPDAARARLQALPGIPWSDPFLLHVGSNLARKNKAGIVRILARLRDEWPGNLVFCGAPPPEELRRQAASAGLGGRVFAVSQPDEAQLEAAYNLAHALLYPSLCEGFGWPVIEAQACGCPVICSDRTSLPEVGGDAALVFPLHDEAGMADAVRRLADPGFHAAVGERGLVNAGRFTAGRMLDDYEQFYAAALAVSAQIVPRAALVS